jgi:molybdenum cofactor biosynthesis enzyme MoaA
VTTCVVSEDTPFVSLLSDVSHVIRFAVTSCLVQARLFVQEGITKIRLTGGEPTLRRDLVEIAQQLGGLPGLKVLAMTTNGVALKRKLEPLRAAGLEALNISLDTMKEDRFRELTRRQGAARVLDVVHLAMEMDFNVKVNNVVMRGVNDDEVLDFVDLTRDFPLNVRFIEYMPFDDNAWSQHKLVRFLLLEIHV